MNGTLVLLALLAGAWSGPKQEGFLGNAWGTHVSRMREVYALREMSRENDRVSYASDIQRLGDADIEECTLEFVRNRFSGVIILTTGRGNSDQLLLYLRQKLGEGRHSDPTAISWIVGSTHVSYDIDSYGDAYVYWYCLICQ